MSKAKGTYVDFDIVDDKGEVIQEGREESCYADMTYGSVPKTTAKVVLYFNDNYKETPYSEKEVRRWVKDVRSWGFPFVYKGINPDYGYEIHMPIKTKRKEYYKNKLHFSSGLTLIRYLYEDRINRLPRKYFELCEEVGKGVDTFKAMQIAHSMLGCGANTNHMLMCQEVSKVRSIEEVMPKVLSYKGSIYSDNGAAITSFWNTHSLPVNVPAYKKDYKKFYKMIVDEKVKKVNVYVVGGDTGYANWLPNTKVVKTLDSADVVLFTGGEDVDPSLYGEPMGKYTGSNLMRDLEEKKIFQKAAEAGKKMLGICRGSQFLCVMAGGKLVQHQQNPLSIHKISLEDGNVINITSTHHQAAYPYNLNMFQYRIIGWTNYISRMHLDGNDTELNPKKECEIVKYHKIKALGIQGHPEFEHFQAAEPESLKVLQELYEKFVTDKL